MPMPIRPVNETDSIFPAAMTDGSGMGLFGLQNSPMQLMMQEELRRRETREVVADRKTGVDPRDVELIHKLWIEQPEESGVMASASEARGMVSFQVPRSANSYELMRLKTNGLAIGSGDTITLTKKGQKVLKDKILASPSSFWLNRTKDGFDIRAAQGKGRLIRMAQDKSTLHPRFEEAFPDATQETASLVANGEPKILFYLDNLDLFNKLTGGEKPTEELIKAVMNPSAEVQYLIENIDQFGGRMPSREEVQRLMTSQRTAGKYSKACPCCRQTDCRCDEMCKGTDCDYLKGSQRKPQENNPEDWADYGADLPHQSSSLQKAIRTAQGRATAPYTHANDPDRSKHPQTQAPLAPTKQIPKFRDWYRKELQPGKDKNVDARSNYVKGRASGWANPYFRPWAAKEYYEKALRHSPGQYPYLPQEKELEADEQYRKDSEYFQKQIRKDDRKKMWDTIDRVRSEAPAEDGWGQTVMAANEAARRAFAQEAEESGADNCTHCKGTGLYPGGYRKRTQKCFYCGGSGKVQ